MEPVTFEDAKAEFEEAWNRLRPTRTEAHFELRRQNRDFTAWKYRLHDKGLKLPTQTKNGLARCFLRRGDNQSLDERAHPDIPPRHRRLGPLLPPDILSRNKHAVLLRVPR
jgi:hypothetical protein